MLLAAVAAGGCSSRLPVQDSSCTTADDCYGYPSCAYRPGGCSCSGGVCWVDPQAPVAEDGCRGCHGSLDNAAPPLSLSGGSDTTEIGVGAHQTHLAGGAFSRAVACEECHVVPQAVTDPGHIDGDGVAEVTFGGVAVTGQSPATWDRGAATCAVYCHGATLSGGANTSPHWTQVDGSQAACGSCHGLPPGGGHPQVSDCESCHAPTAGPNQTIANRDTHIDGVVQVVGGAACNSCHGIPPSTGQHQVHVSAGYGCDECHNGEVDGAGTQILDASRHQNGVADVSLKQGGTWDPGTSTCTPACHEARAW